MFLFTINNKCLWKKPKRQVDNIGENDWKALKTTNHTSWRNETIIEQCDYKRQLSKVRQCDGIYGNKRGKQENLKRQWCRNYVVIFEWPQLYTMSHVNLWFFILHIILFWIFYCYTNSLSLNILLKKRIKIEYILITWWVLFIGNVVTIFFNKENIFL